MASISEPRVGWRLRACRAGMTALLTVGALLQLNDPDPVGWTLVYAAAALASWFGVRSSRIWLPAGVGLAAAVWGLILAGRVEDVRTLTVMFDAWEMRSPAVELAREVSGLFLIAAWMGILVLLGRRRARRRGATPTA